MATPHLESIDLPPALAGAACDFVFDRTSVRALDQAAIEEFGLPSSVLMENAATALAHVANQLLCRERQCAIIACGPGNNGGDGFALARKLLNLGHDVRVMTFCDESRFKGDAAMNLKVIQRMQAPIHFIADQPSDELNALAQGVERGILIVDALFGTGLDAPVRAPYDAAVRWINAYRRGQSASCVLAIDIPSGLDCDSGLPLGDQSELTVHADVTVTLAGHKLGLRSPESRDYAGRVLAADIGAPLALLERFGRPIGDAA